MISVRRKLNNEYFYKGFLHSCILAFLIFNIAAWAGNVLANPVAPNQILTPVIADLHLLKQIKVQVQTHDPELNIGLAFLDLQAQHNLSLLAHRYGKCGGFEALSKRALGNPGNINLIFQDLKSHMVQDVNYSRAPFRAVTLPKRPEIETAISLAEVNNLMSVVNWLSAFPNRYNRDPSPNEHVVQLQAKLEKMLQAFHREGSVVFIEHQSTKQKSIRLRLLGATRPQEIIVLGGHLDSINLSGDRRAPGSDDNASGSANLIEALRVILAQPRLARTLDFFWYAGEESGLLGSAEIAKQYKEAKMNVIGVLQLDMTLFPGDGELEIGSMTDFTSSWMREVLGEINKNYLGAKIIDDKCGYGCSDHASWYRQGFPTLMPFESTMRKMNRNIHTANDIVTPLMSWKHSLMYTKIAIALAMELGNNPALRQPY